MDIYWLDTPACWDPARVGGKAANLGRLAGRHQVPPGFCLSAAEVGESVLSSRQQIQLATAYAHLGRRCKTSEPPVAVRSSAVDEDGQHASFAGQHETFLNVVGAGAVASAVQRCLASAQSERARTYRRTQGLSESARMAVLVQHLVVADVSAVVFSVDPGAGARDHVVINATWGLGESLVGGIVTPDLYVVQKEDLTIVSRQIGDKACMTVPHHNGTVEVAVPGCLRREPALDEEQIRELACLARMLEREEGWPVDLECAYQGRRLYLLQCRPVTTMGVRRP